MTLYEFEGKKPIIGKGTYIFDSADVIGDVVIGDFCYIGPGARLRGDYGRIGIGNHSAIEDNVVVHARPDDITHIGNHATIGHSAIIHNAKIYDWAVIGMGAVVSDWAEIGEWAVVGEGAVVKNRDKIPDGKIAVGIPAKVVADVTSQYKVQWETFKNIYSSLASQRYPEGLKRMSNSQTK